MWTLIGKFDQSGCDASMLCLVCNQRALFDRRLENLLIFVICSIAVFSTKA